MGRPKVNLTRDEIRRSVEVFFDELVLPEEIRDIIKPRLLMPASYGIVIGTEVENNGVYTFEPHKRAPFGEFGEYALNGALMLAQAAVARDIAIPGYVSLRGCGVAVSGFEEMNPEVAQHVLGQVVWAS